MPVTYSIDGGSRIIRTVCSGAVTFPEVLEHFQSLGADPACSGMLDVCLDLSETTSLPEARQIQSVSEALAAVRSKAQFRACAIVARSDALFGMMRMFSIFAEKHFRAIHVFRSSAEAEAWLASQAAARHTPPGS